MKEFITPRLKLSSDFSFFLNNIKELSRKHLEEKLLKSCILDNIKNIIDQDAFLEDVQLMNSGNYVFLGGDNHLMCMLLNCPLGYVGGIHDHATWAISSVIHGSLAHDFYIYDHNGCVYEKTITLERGETLMLESDAIHRIRNSHDNQQVWALHVYGLDLRTVYRYQYKQGSSMKEQCPNSILIDVEWS
ncbi:MAG: hypothetical protein VXY77_01390 [Pseudomonadota bacterium]|nr:hypothetical protein [Pseudomonadota bacterium]